MLNSVTCLWNVCWNKNALA